MNQSDQLTVKFVSQLTNDRFFTVPQLSGLEENPKPLRAHLRPEKPNKRKRSAKMIRYAAYVRISSEEQVGNFSVEAQKRAIAAWVKAKEEKTKIVDFYVDEAQSGRSLNRPEFQRMRRDAKKGKFDAIIVHKFDRFARNRTDALAIKSLLRHEYGVKVYSVSEPSEDSDGPMGALIEGIMESVADWYSRNLATETTKGKRERARQGYHNNRPPFGYDKTEEGLLIPNEEEISGLRAAFTLYTTGDYSDRQIAKFLNDEGFTSKTGRPFSIDTVRDMLQNRTYLGYVRYQQYKRRNDGSRSWEHPVEWFEGKHDPIIDEELFELCQQVRVTKRRRTNQHYPKHRHYLLRGIIFCAECVENMPEDVQDDDYGKMRPQYNTGYKYYRCRASDFGRECSQTSVRCEGIEEQVIGILKTLKPPADWRDRMVQAVGQMIGDKSLEERTAEIMSIIERMDFRWDQGFITDQDHYLEQRLQLQQELEKLKPVPDDELELAADILSNFKYHWNLTEDDREKQEELIKLIVARVWVKDGKVVAISLRPNYHITLGLETEKPTPLEVDSPFVQRRERRALYPHWLSDLFHPQNRPQSACGRAFRDIASTAPKRFLLENPSLCSTDMLPGMFLFQKHRRRVPANIQPHCLKTPHHQLWCSSIFHVEGFPVRISDPYFC
jgi:DNA invertase Pin-like site-specific DNA recombinase